MPTSPRRRFTLPKRLQGAARSWLDEADRAPRKPRLASSVALVRDAPDGTETWLTYRTGDSPLGVVAFPGGSVENADQDSFDWFGPSVGQWAEVLGTEDYALARVHVVAAIRELFEETGVLLAGSDESVVVEGTSTADWVRAREALAGQEIGFAELLAKRGLGLRTDLLRSLVHWVTPDFAHRRFDTRYFAATLPVGQTPTLLPSKGVWGQWVSAATLMAEKETSALGDEVGEPDTRGLALPELLVPATEIILAKMAKARGCIAYLNIKRSNHVYQAELVEDAGQLYLEVSAPGAVVAPPTEALRAVGRPAEQA
ncbi:8-oxo-dGTP pyrophosphatase MutT (NUDIX family) [Sinomonas atrocyanea]|uniref:NUDIX hydrolase n=1 Tax=Sinomonas atrocyanea TaxID=37927 RepID=UPI0027800713|nr:NUDIX hydrolase [Sinomonas atrocyanea]MDP9886307.1 8-oxo-dGTP pyrophosphatase MutT (NUDIX family) [Sinomonas atrocyanea]